MEIEEGAIETIGEAYGLETDFAFIFECLAVLGKRFYVFSYCELDIRDGRLRDNLDVVTFVVYMILHGQLVSQSSKRPYF